MAFSVTRTRRSTVKPAEKTAISSSSSTTTLDLSPIDRLHVLRCNARTLHVFKHGPEAAIIIRKSLSKALVPYFPLAGRLIESQNGDIQVQCSGDGVWFVEANASCSLDSVNYFNDVESVPYDDLLPDPVPETEHIEPLVQMQVLNCICGTVIIIIIS